MSKHVKAVAGFKLLCWCKTCMDLTEPIVRVLGMRKGDRALGNSRELKEGNEPGGTLRIRDLRGLVWPRIQGER